MPQPTVTMAVVAAEWGPIHLAATEAGVVALDTLTTREAFVEHLERRLHREVVSGSHPILDDAAGQVEEFLEGDRRVFELPLDLRDRPAWDRAVLEAVCDVPWGRTASYGAIARAIDRPGAARAVGGAVGRSPMGLIVPCHRIIAGDGSLGGYGGAWFGSREAHLELKSGLLAREGIDIPVPWRTVGGRPRPAGTLGREHRGDEEGPR
jgi:methylated-DNA-[protein]-cysteine S-methyltransferase